MRIPIGIWLLIPAFIGCRQGDLRGVAKKYEATPFFQARTNNCLEISAIYVTPEWKAIEAILANAPDNGYGNINLDSAIRRSSLSRSMEFRINVSPEPKCRDLVNFHNSDVVYSGAASNATLEANVKAFNETLGDRIWLKAGDSRIKPTLCHVESSFGLDNSRVIWVEFETDERIEAALKAEKEFELIVDNITPGRGLFTLSWPRKVLNRRA